MVKVEVWDVVDEGLANEQLSAAEIISRHKETGSEGGFTIAPLDASVIDVYKDAHVVMFVVNPFDVTSFEYLK